MRSLTLRLYCGLAMRAKKFLRPDEDETILALIERGTKIIAAAEAFNVSRPAIYAAMDRARAARKLKETQETP